MASESQSEGLAPVLGWGQGDLQTTVTSRFDRIADAMPAAVAVQAGGRAWTYGELRAAVDRCAAALVALDLPSNALIGLYVPTGFDFFAGYLGVLKAGHIVLPLDVRRPPGRLKAVLAATRPELALVSASTHQTMDASGAGLRTIEYGAWPGSEGEDAFPRVPVNVAATVYLTSGSTGEPKGVTRDQRVMMHHALVYSQDHDIGSGDRQSFLYSTQSGASMPDMLGALLNGAVLCPWDAGAHSVAELAAWIDREGITLLHLPIGLLRLLLQNLPADRSFPSLRVVLAGGEAAFKSDVVALRDRVSEDCVFVHQLSATETNYMTRNILRADTPLEDEVLTVGAPARDKRVLLLDDDGMEPGAGEVGQIVVESPYLAVGYWHDPELTQSKFKPVEGSARVRRFHTGDLGQWTSTGLRHMGRADQQVRISGHRVELAEVEAALHGWQAARQAVVSAQTDVPDGPRLVAYVVPRDPPHPPTQDAMRAYLAARLPEPMVPTNLVVLESLPLLATGKVDRDALPKPHDGRPSLRTSFEPPRGLYEERLQRLWENVLGIRPIGVRDAFFDLGGTSLQAMRLIAKVSKEFGELLPQASLLQTPTIEKQALMLRSEQISRPSARLVGIQPDGNRIPFFCISPRNVDVLAYRNLALALGEEQPFYALYSVDMPRRPDGVASIEHQADVFVEDVLKVARESPLAIGGYSHGGIVAFEMARRLRQRGHQVALLVLMDVYGPAYRRMRPPLPAAAYRPLQALRSLQRSLAESIPWLQDHLRILGRLAWPDRWIYISSKARNHLRWWETRAARGFGALKERVRNGRSANTPSIGKSYRDYRPQRYSGSTVVFRASHQPLGIQQDLMMGWGEVLDGDVEVIMVPGYHDSILFRPRISFLAGELERLLARATGSEAVRRMESDD